MRHPLAFATFAGFATFALGCAVALSGCGVDDGSQRAAASVEAPVGVVDGPGLLVGQVCDRHTLGVVSGALVTVVRDEDGMQRSVHADDDGNFALELPAGEWVGEAWGSGFADTFGFSIASGMATDIPFQGCPGDAVIALPGR